VHILLEIVNSQ